MEYNFIIAELNYFCLLKDWGFVIDLCKKYNKSEFDINLFKSLSYFNLMNFQEGLDSIPSNVPKDYKLATLYLKRELYNSNSNYDLANKISTNELELLDESSEFALYVAFEICLHLNLEKECFDIIGKLGFNFRGYLARGYFELIQKDKISNEKALENFIKAKEWKSDNIHNIYGMLKVYQILKKNDEIFSLIEELENLDSNINNLISFNIEKLKIYWILSDFNNFENILKQNLDIEKDCLILYKYSLLYDLVHKGNYENVLKILEIVKPIFDKYVNIDFEINFWKFVIRLCGRNISILSYSLRLLQNLNKNNPGNPIIMKELANNFLLLNDIGNAKNLYKNVSEIEEENESLIKLIEISLLSGNLNEAESQIEFFKEVMEINNEKTSDLIFLNSIIKCRKGKLAKENKNKIFEEVISLFDKAIKNHIENCKELNEGFEFYIILNPDFILNLCKEIIDEYDFNITLLKDDSNNALIPLNLLEKISRIIKIIINKITGLVSGRLFYIKCLIILKDFTNASLECNKIIENDNKIEEAYIWLALIYLLEGNNEKSLKIISEALSINFDILNNPFFALVKAEAEINLKSLDEAEKTLNKIINNKNSLKLNKAFNIFKIDDTINGEIMINLSKIYINKKEPEKAKNIIQEAIINYSDDENTRGIIQLGSSEIYRINGEIKNSIEILQNFDLKDKFYIISQKRLANIYLNELKHRRNYALIIKNLTNKFPSINNYIILGDCYLNINEPYEAIEAYNKALENDESNEDILIKLGNALILSHNYNKAKEFYESKIYEEGSKIVLKSEYIKLLKKLKSFDKIEKITGFKFDFNNDYISLNITALNSYKKLKFKTFKETFALAELLNILSSIYYSKMITLLEVSFDNSNLEDIKTFYLKLLDLTIEKYRFSQQKAKIEGKKTKIIKERRSFLYLNYSKFHYMLTNNIKKSQEYINDCIKLNPNNIDILTICAERSFLNGEYNKSKELSKKLIKSSKKNFIGLKILLDCLIIEKNFESSFNGFKKIWDSDNNNFSALSCLICCYRVLGKLSEVNDIIEKLDLKLKNFEDPSYNYAKGLYYYFIKNPVKAIENLAKSKNSKQFKYSSIILLIDIYLNPEQELFYSKFLLKEKFKKINEENIESIYLLFEELDKEEYLYEIQTYKAAIEIIQGKNLKDNNTILESLKEKCKNKASIICYFLIICSMKSKNNNLKNCLVNLNKLDYISYYGYDDYYDKSLITCADFLLDKNKIENSSNKIQKILNFNKSSFLTYQFNIVIKEKNKEDYYKILNFLWKLSNFSDIDIGFKLGKSLINNLLYEKAIDVGNKLLQIDRNSKEVYENIMKPARIGIRGGV